MTITRRDFMLGASSLTLLGAPYFNARAEQMAKRNLIVIMLRGGMDGLTAVPPKDKILTSERPDIEVGGTLPLTSDFDLHPSLTGFHDLWRAGKASVVHATSIPYTQRSHFDGQDVMQSGGLTPYAEKTGWLGRGIAAAGLSGLALSLPMPLILRGGQNPDNYYPARFSLPRQDILDRVAQSYKGDEAVQAVMSRIQSRPSSMSYHSGTDAVELARKAAVQIKQADGPRIAVFDIGGFDTHAAQGGADGEHGEKLSKFDRVLSRLSSGLGGEIDNTLILTVTEFGRKIEQNGGYGTEHGYGTAILMAGGLLKQSQIFADWPGLSVKHRFEGQDLLATIDARAIYCSAMATCFDVDFDKIRRAAFFGHDLPDYRDALFAV